MLSSEYERRAERLVSASVVYMQWEEQKAWQMTVRTTKQIASYLARVPGHEACKAVQQT